jgi:hypothetical protein
MHKKKKKKQDQCNNNRSSSKISMVGMQMNSLLLEEVEEKREINGTDARVPAT